LNAQPELPADDAPVPDPTRIFRLVPTDYCEVGDDGEWVFQSGAFDNNDGDDMSVALGDTLEALGRTPDDLPERTFPQQPERWGVAVVEAGYLKNDEEQEIRRTPTHEERAHGDVRGRKRGNRRKRIKKHAAWVFPPSAAPE
jgi:hypothetical protein